MSRRISGGLVLLLGSLLIAVVACAPKETTVSPVVETSVSSASDSETMVSPKDGMVLVYVPEGEFEMGSDEGDPDERPMHTVNLDAFWIDQTEVTNDMFGMFVDETGYETAAEKQGWSWVVVPASGWEDMPGAYWMRPQGPGSGIDDIGDHPVVHMSWNDAWAYCEWAGRRLPTEAEWEKAARGEDGRMYPWGNELVVGGLLNFADKNLGVEWADNAFDDGYEFTAPVGSYPDGASPYGALDMAGNVWEWVADWYAEDYYGAPIEANPTGPSVGVYRVVRGGSWGDTYAGVRTTFRNWNSPNDSIHFNGFRCALSS